MNIFLDIQYGLRNIVPRSLRNESATQAQYQDDFDDSVELKTPTPGPSRHVVDEELYSTPFMYGIESGVKGSLGRTSAHGDVDGIDTYNAMKNTSKISFPVFYIMEDDITLYYAMNVQTFWVSFTCHQS